MDKIGYLKETDLFIDMPATEMDKMGESFRMANFSKGELIYQPDQQGEFLFVLKRGRVRIYRLSPDGKELTLTELSAGTIFGEMALFGQTMYGSYAEAKEDCVICVINRDSALHMLKAQPEITLRLVEIVGKRLLFAENRLESLGLRDVPHRLAALLLEMTGDSNNLRVDQRYTHDELAKMIGTSRESVTLTLNEFRQRGWVNTSDHRICISDACSLRDYVGL